MSNDMEAMNPGMIDLTQLNIGGMIREYGEEEIVKLVNMIIENSKKMLELQKTIVMLMEKEKKKKQDQRRRQEDREQKRREYEERWEKEKKRRRKG